MTAPARPLQGSTIRKARRCPSLMLALWLPLACATPAMAAPQLDESVEVTAEVVTLGDLIGDAGDKSHKAVFLAPKIGETGYISTSRVIEAARSAGIILDTRNAPARIAVTRLGRAIGKEEVLESIREELNKRLPAGDDRQLVVEVKDDVPATYIDIANQAPIPAPRLDWSQRTGLFRADFSLPGGVPLTVRGNANVMSEISVPRVDLSEGTVVAPADLETRLVVTGSIAARTVTAADKIVGLEVRRRLPAGKPVQDGDLAAPLLIHRNQLVSIVLEIPGLKLRAEGKALADAGQGDSIKVMNTQSKRIIDATAVAAGVVSVNPAKVVGSGS
jgi:flagella basal body P-ring formation protein FlgA